MWFHCPYQVLPEEWLSDETFMREWRKHQDNKHIILNADEVLDFEHVTEATEETELYDNYSYEVEDTLINRSTSYARQTDHTVISINEEKRLHNYNNALVSTVNNITYNGKSQGQVVTHRENHEKEVSNTINSIEEGPSMFYRDNILIQKKWRENNHASGAELFFYGSGRLRTKRLSKLPNLEEVIIYKDVENSPIERITEFHGNQKLSSTYYYDSGHYVKSNYVLGGDHRNLPVSYDFYTKTASTSGTEWYRYGRITNPTSRDEIKTITKYSVDGNIVTESTGVKDLVFNLEARKWRR